MINNSVMKCIICNNKKCGEFITINDKKYHLCCINQQQNNWNELKKWLKQLQKFKGINQQGFSWGVAQEVLDKMQELEGNNE